MPVRIRRSVFKSGRASVTVPRADSRVAKGFVRLFGRGDSYRVNLDAYGTSVWRLCDGRRSVREIGDRLERIHGEEVKPVYPRLIKFLRAMELHGLIKFKKH